MFTMLPLTLCTQTMLSAIVKQLRAIGHQKIDGRSHLIHLAVSAFPDAPTLVSKTRLHGRNRRWIEEWKRPRKNFIICTCHSYSIQPMVTRSARQDVDLVKEWCYLSVQGKGNSVIYNQDKMMNFRVVASRKQPDFRMYRRDLPLSDGLGLPSRRNRVNA
jgi:hypothetical protein